MLKKKAPQSEMDRLAQKLNNIPPFPGFPPIPPMQPQSHPENHFMQVNGTPERHEMHKQQQGQHQPGNGDAYDETPGENEDQFERNGDQKNPYLGEKAVLIMDSNMNHIKQSQFWSDTFKLKCGKAVLLENKLKQYNLSKAEHIIIGTGTNDIECGFDAPTIFNYLIDSAKKLSTLYKSAHLYIAQLPPMAGYEATVQELNEIIKKQCSRKCKCHSS